MDASNFEEIIKIVGTLLSSMLVMVICQHLGFQLIYRKLGIKGFRIFIMPFVLLHELAHFCVAIMLNFKNVKLNIGNKHQLDRELGSVSYVYPVSFFGVVGVTLVSFSPLVLAIVIIYLMCLYSNLNILTVPLEKEVIGTILIHFYHQLNVYEITIGAILLCGISLGLTPSIQDLKLSIRGIFLISFFTTIIVAGMKFLNISLMGDVMHALAFLSKLFVIGAASSSLAFLLLNIAYYSSNLVLKSRRV